MFLRRGAVAMVGNDSGEVKCQRGDCTRWHLVRNGIENVGREAGKAMIAGEKIRAKQEPETLAVKAHVPVGVTREMDGSQAVPYVDEVAVVEQAVRNERMKG
jgi:hypothetical protein